MTDLLAPAARDPRHGTARAPTDDHHELARRIDSVLERLAGDPRLVHVRRLDPRAARVATLAAPLPDELAERVPAPLWSHQVTAIEHVRAGRSVAVATGTSSGKSLCYQIPIAEAVAEGATALVVYPTKALAQDQLLAFGRLAPTGLVAATYDGDCSPEERSWVRRHADVVLTNPEMLHHGILANHGRWGEFLHRLRIVVVDELHVLRGVFGTHVAQVLRRLARLAAHYGAPAPTYVFSSATIGEPERLAAELCGRPVVPVTDDGSPVGTRSIALWHPGRGDADDRGWSVHTEAARVASHLVGEGLRTLVFCRSRRATEVVAQQLRAAVCAPPGSIRSYRAGYLPEERREVEAELFAGRLRAVAATSALELGVDLGGLDAVVLCGFPGTVSSFWQQVGRSGRSGRPSLSVLVAGEDQLDNWMFQHPHELFGRHPEPAVVNLSNPHVVEPHVGCAAHELALTHRDLGHWPDQLDDAVRSLVHSGRLTVRRGRRGVRAVWSGRGSPAAAIGLRAVAQAEVRIVDADGRRIGTVDRSRAPATVHPGAVYLHQGRSWRVQELDLDAGVAVVVEDDGAHSTHPRTERSIRLLRVDRTRRVGRTELRLGDVEVTTRVTGYRVRDAVTGGVVASEPLELPPTQLHTRAIWYEVDDASVRRAGVEPGALAGALHAIEHAAIGILPLFTICDRWDVGGVSTTWLPETGVATIVIHDAHPGGAGIAELAYEAADRHLSSTLELVRGCACRDGCPSCVQSPKCGNDNQPLDRHAAVRLLGELTRPRPGPSAAPPPAPDPAG